ncbi:hypothetical protein C8Q76DRAFT_796938 [Earliella scabrosa]|nr:hypothetical protein C8Q76DRAFT_796938 [Earliella scabrosa]
MSNVFPSWPQLDYHMPIAVDRDSGTIKGVDPKGALFRNPRNVQDSRQWTVGPMPVQDFLDNFLPFHDDESVKGMLSSRNAFKSVLPRGSTAADICEPLIKALNSKTKDKISSDQITSTSSREPSSRAEFGYAELFVEVAANPTQDVFTDPPAGASPDVRAAHDFVTSSNDASSVDILDRAWGQHISYVTELFARQLRVFVFTVAMSGSCARLFRWDRAGCIVTESFDIRSHPQFFCDFFWRFALTSDAGRGHDTTVCVASVEEEALFRDSIAAHLKTQLRLEGTELDKAVSEHYEAHRVAVYHVLQHAAIANSETIHRYLVSRPVVSPLFLDGRGTRGFWAVDEATGNVVFLKDTWRFGGLEGLTLAYMNEEEVRNVPVLANHGDVPDFIPESERLFEPVMDAHTSTSLLHRDISLANIILVPEPGRARRRGYLVDWDAACEVDATGASISPGRAGTWAFMSFALLFRWGRDLSTTISTFFDFRDVIAGETFGGMGKTTNAFTRMYTDAVGFKSALQEWVDSMMDLFWPILEPMSRKDSLVDVDKEHHPETQQGAPGSGAYSYPPHPHDMFAPLQVDALP